MLTTGVFIRLGYVYGNLMVNVQPKNSKLLDRARRIVAGATGLSYDKAGEALIAAGNDVKTAIVMSRSGCSREEAPARLAAASGRITGALKEMDKFVIEGGTRLEGEIPTNGSKNSALPALAAALLTDGEVKLRRIPRVRDIRTMQRLLVDIGTQMAVEDDCVVLNTPQIVSPEAPYELVKTMRASSLVLGPLVARTGRARVSCRAVAPSARVPSICTSSDSNARRHDLSGTRLYRGLAPDGLKGAQVNFERITVTGTEDLMMAAVLAQGETMLENAAREPEVVDLAEMLVKMGAQIEGAGTSTIRIQGVGKLAGVDHTIIPDRIEAGTFVVAGAITGGDVRITDCVPEHFAALSTKLKQAGVGCGAD